MVTKHQSNEKTKKYNWIIAITRFYNKMKLKKKVIDGQTNSEQFEKHTNFQF